MPSQAAADTATFTNSNSITIPDSGNATPYPASVNVTGMGGLITDVNLKVENIGHTHPDDLDILLVSPSGDSTVLMSDACNGADFEDFDWTWDDEAAGAMPDSPAGACTSFFYRPSSYDGSSDTWPGAFPGPHGTTMSRFDGENPNGAWHLYVRDDAGSDSGDIEGGFQITIETGPYVARFPGTGSSGNASPYPLNVNVSGQTGVITDVNLVFNGLTHSHPDDLDMLLVGPQGQRVIFMSDACGSFDVANYFWRWDDEAPAVMTDSGSTNVCSPFNHRPTNHGAGDSFPGPAPGGPYGSTMTEFDLTDPNGTWRVFVVDDAGGDEGFLINAPTLEFTTRAKANVVFASNSATLDEGAGGTLTLNRSASGPMGAGSVTVTSTPGTAGGSDFTAINTVVSFAAGEASKTVPIQSTGDAADEPNETFTVSLSSPSGDASAGTPASATVTINDDDQPSVGGPPDTKAPNTTIDKGPKKKTEKDKAKFKFSSDEPGSTFECALDKKSAFESCKSPAKYKNLDDGKHKFFVRATDAAGNVDATPAKLKWKVL